MELGGTKYFVQKGLFYRKITAEEKIIGKKCSYVYTLRPCCSNRSNITYIFQASDVASYVLMLGPNQTYSTSIAPGTYSPGNYLHDFQHDGIPI